MSILLYPWLVKIITFLTWNLLTKLTRVTFLKNACLHCTVDTQSNFELAVRWVWLRDPFIFCASNKVRRSEIEWSSHFWARAPFCHSGSSSSISFQCSPVKLTMITVKKRTYCSIISLFISTWLHSMTGGKINSFRDIVMCILLF